MNIEVDKEAWERACKLVECLAKNIGGIAPGDYSNLYFDLNQHSLYAKRLEKEKKAE